MIDKIIINISRKTNKPMVKLDKILKQFMHRMRKRIFRIIRKVKENFNLNKMINILITFKIIH